MNHINIALVQKSKLLFQVLFQQLCGLIHSTLLQIVAFFAVKWLNFFFSKWFFYYMIHFFNVFPFSQFLSQTLRRTFFFHRISRPYLCGSFWAPKNYLFIDTWQWKFLLEIPVSLNHHSTNIENLRCVFQFTTDLT